MDCPVCCEVIDNANRHILHCTHEFHISCLLKWREQCNKTDQMFTCPVCRESLQYSHMNIIAGYEEAILRSKEMIKAYDSLVKILTAELELREIQLQLERKEQSSCCIVS